MSAEMVGTSALIMMFVLMMMRIPIAVSMALPAVLGVLYLKGWVALSTAVETIIWDHSYSYILSTLPMFVLMGEMLNLSGISNELFSSFRAWFGRLKGGLGMATIGASAVFSAASGSSVANTGTIGVMATKEMINSGYSKALAGGSIVAGGSLGILIPPSTFLIIYGMLSEQSIGKLLAAGIIPGILLALFFMITIYIAVSIRPDLAPPSVSGSWKQRLISLKSTVWILALFIVVIGGMFAGFFGPTEAAGIGAFSAMMMALMKKRLNLKTFLQALQNTTLTTGFIFAIILAAFVFNYMLTISKVPLLISSSLTEANLSPAVTFLLIVIMYFVLGALMDSYAAVVVTVPIVMPIVTAMGHDLVWFGVVLCILVEGALISPPHGMNILVLNGVVPELQIEKIFKGAFLFLIPIFTLVILLYLFPEIALYLPSKMVG